MLEVSPFLCNVEQSYSALPCENYERSDSDRATSPLNPYGESMLRIVLSFLGYSREACMRVIVAPLRAWWEACLRRVRTFSLT